ncbi:MAG: DNA/RNA endonuclease [Salinivirgaceae bacterium]|nr:MAG: DNA/RNA endonuclease [Salinivirgaceae bacterium]
MYFRISLLKITISITLFVSVFLSGCGYAGSGALELPAKASNEQIISHKAYALVYDEETEQAKWVAWELTNDELNGDAKRKNNFKEDPLILTGSATDADYSKSGYDRGHLAPAADMTWSQLAMDESFYYSNMSPQHPSLNRGIWKRLETKTREWAEKYEKIYVATGPVFINVIEEIGPNKVDVPSHYYKTFLITKDNDLQTIAFLIPNEKGDKDIFEYAVTVDSIEHITNIDFYHLLHDRYEDKVESTFDLDYWK